MNTAHPFSSKRVFYLSLSFAIHLSLFFAVKLFKIPKTQEKKSILVELSQPTKEEFPQKVNNQTRRGTSASKKISHSKISLKQFKSDWPILPPKEVTKKDTSAFSFNETTNDDPSAPWGEGSAHFSRLEDLGLMNRVYANVEQALFYPGILAHHSIEGIVNARLILKDDGHCDWRQTTISSTESHLKVFILSVLKETCTFDFKRYVRGRHITNVDLSFEFELTEHNDQARIASKKKIVGNVLLFYRNSQHSIAEWHLGPFNGLFPIPLVAVDFGWLQENWEKVIDKKDPLREYKESMPD